MKEIPDEKGEAELLRSVIEHNERTNWQNWLTEDS